MRLVEQTTASWEFWFGLLEQFVERNGHARVPHSYTVDGYRLGGGSSRNASRHAKGTLDADRERRLQELPGWTWDPDADQWEEGFAAFWTTSNATVTPASRSPTRSMATRSVMGRVQRENHAKGTLDADRKRRLQELPGWTWDPYADQWEEGFSRLLDYVERHGDARVPRSYTVDGYQLGTWVEKQRAKLRQRHP